MSEQNKGKIQALTVQNFTCFEDVSFEFSTGINVFIGENGTGKTHILKLLYASLSNPYQSYPILSERYHKKFDDVFKETIGYLLRKKILNGTGLGYVSIKKSNKNFNFEFGLGT